MFTFALYCAKRDDVAFDREEFIGPFPTEYAAQCYAEEELEEARPHRLICMRWPE